MKQKATNIFFSILIISGLTAFVKNNLAPKTYTVTLSLDEWRGVLQAEDSSRKILIKSDLPTKETNYVISNSFSLTQIISTQVSEQITAETKKDSTNTAKPKNK